jgi:hypothetical protein
MPEIDGPPDSSTSKKCSYAANRFIDLVGVVTTTAPELHVLDVISAAAHDFRSSALCARGTWATDFLQWWRASVASDTET